MTTNNAIIIRLLIINFEGLQLSQKGVSSIMTAYDNGL